MKILVYGSLREGEYNFDRIKDAYGKASIRKVGEKEVDGFQMHNLGFYPAIKKGEGTIKCDILEVSEKAALFIDSMEVGAGYIKTEVDGLPIYEMNRNVSNYPLVKSGDWTKK